MNRRVLSCQLLLANLCAAPILAQTSGDWIQLFNGRNLEGWIPKISGYELGENYANTFRVQDGYLTISYEGYTDFGKRFGHIFYKDKFSHYRLGVEYRFFGAQAPNGPAWATRNSGIMVHCQDPKTMTKDQDFPISIEVQLLGGLGKGPRPTANLCTPGTHVVKDGELLTRHCTNSASSTYDGDQWVRVEVEVLGNRKITHFVEGKPVLSYEKPQIGGEVVSHYDPKVKIDGKMLDEGWISLQSESHPVQFRKVELLPLRGCMDRKSKRFRPWYIHSDPSQCK